MDQSWNAQEYALKASFVPNLGLPVFGLLRVVPGERILDLGCGDGRLTVRLQQAGADVLGLDASPEMVGMAVDRGVRAQVGSGERLGFEAEFDAVFSNAALHWMQDGAAVIAGAWRALKPGGRFVGEFGGEKNMESVVAAMKSAFEANPDFGPFVNPWYFPSASEYRTALETGGFLVESVECFARPTTLEIGVVEWLSIFGNGIFGHLDSDQRSRFFRQVTEKLGPGSLADRGWVADYVRLQFVATKPADPRFDAPSAD